MVGRGGVGVVRAGGVVGVVARREAGGHGGGGLGHTRGILRVRGGVGGGVEGDGGGEGGGWGE